MLLRPALPDIRAAGLLADGDEPVLADDVARLCPSRGARSADADPVGFPQHRRVRPVRLFGVTRPGRRPGLLITTVDQRDHEPYPLPTRRPARRLSVCCGRGTS